MDLELLLQKALESMSLSKRSPASREANLKKAISLFSQILEIDNKQGNVYRYRGAVYSGLSQFEEALADFNKAVEL